MPTHKFVQNYFALIFIFCFLGFRRLGPIYWDNLGVGYSGVFIADPVAARKVFLVEGSRPRHVVPQPWVLYNKRYNCKRGLFFM